MPLNEQRGNMFSFIQFTVNPLGGPCEYECSFCSTPIIGNFRKVVGDKYSGEYLLYTKELYKWGNERGTIFIENMGDLFAKGVPNNYIETVLEHCNKYAGNTYLFCTKNPERYFNYIHKLNTDFPENVILGTTIETNKYPKGVTSKAPKHLKRANAMNWLSKYRINFRRMVSIEPILKFNKEKLIQLIMMCKPEFVYIGYDSKNQDLPEPTNEEVLELITELKTFTTVLLKPNAEKRLGVKE